MSHDRSSATPRIFRKKPVAVDAMQYTLKNRDAIIKWVGNKLQHLAVDEEGAEYELQNLRIHTLEGVMRADLGDWIVRGIGGEFYPVKPNIFEKTYEPA